MNEKELHEYKKNALNQYRYDKIRMDALIAEKIEWEHRRDLIGGSGYGCTTSHDVSSRTELVASKISDIISRLEAEIGACNDSMINVLGLINSVQNERKRAVLVMRYITGMSGSGIAIKLNKDRGTVRKVLESAIDSIEFPE